MRVKIIFPEGDWSTDVTCTSDGVADPPPAALDDDHRPVVEIADALVRLLALADEADLAAARRGAPRA